MIKVTINEREMAKAFDRVMREKMKDGHEFKSMNVGGMEKVCDICYSIHTESEG